MARRETKDVQIAVRLTSELLERVDAYAEELRNQHPGIDATRAAAVRALLLRGLEAAERDRSRQR